MVESTKVALGRFRKDHIPPPPQRKFLPREWGGKFVSNNNKCIGTSGGGKGLELCAGVVRLRQTKIMKKYFNELLVMENEVE